MSRAEVDEGRRNDMNRRQSLCVGCSGEVVISGFCCRPSSRVDVCVCGAESCWMSKKIDVIWGESAWGGCFIASGASRWCTIGSKYDPHRPSWIPIHTFATIQSSWMIAMYAYLPITAYSTCSELLAWFFCNLWCPIFVCDRCCVLTRYSIVLMFCSISKCFLIIQ